MEDIAKGQFFERLRTAMAAGEFIRMNLTVPTGRDPQIRAINVRPVRLRGEDLFSFVYRYATRDVTKNIPPEDAYPLLDEIIGSEFLSAFLSTTKEVAQLGFRKGRPTRLLFGKPEGAVGPDLRHDRVRQKAIEPQKTWLQSLGVTMADGGVKAGMEPKFRQMNRFVEILGHLLDDVGPSLRRDPVLVDMGCGKGYLTFAAYEFLRTRGYTESKGLGIELRPELVNSAQKLADSCGFDGLKFQSGEIASAQFERVDILMALHACDTATDDAIAKGVQLGASLIVVAPCCHKEVRPQMDTPPVLEPVLRHGIFRERNAEIVTDAMRAQMLECAGYSAKVFEFISPEHTSKNVMIAAVRRPVVEDNAEAIVALRSLAQFFGIKHQRLADLLKLDLVAPTSVPS
ncbi:MAG TPA: SAM-dependent methyltransferase [Candidatus Limnocylindria bacterium]|nr:SAM-dependent methyltransferase [Candidatus Limnocylindria bacterium]